MRWHLKSCHGHLKSWERPPWWFSGKDSLLPRQGSQAPFPGQGTKIPHAARLDQKVKINKIK